MVGKRFTPQDWLKMSEANKWFAEVEKDKLLEENSLLKEEITALKLKIIQLNELIFKQQESVRRQYLLDRDYLPYDEEDNYR